MTQHLGHQQFPAQAFSNYDPAAPIYYSAVTPAPAHYAYQDLQFNYHRLAGQIHPQYQEEARRHQQLQQDAIFQQQQAMYHQQMLACQQQQQQQHYQTIQLPSPGKSMQTKADRRAVHNATERLRRENLNSKFQQLAHSLPNLQDDRRPSKGTIIERTLDFVKNTIRQEEKFISEIRKLRKEYEDLMQQLYPGQSLSTCASILSDDDIILSNKGSTSISDLRSQNSSPCPSLELSSKGSPKLSPTAGLESASLFEAYGMDINPLNDVMFGHFPDQQQQQKQQQLAAPYESDDDSSSTNPSDLDLTNATITTSMSTVPARIDDKDTMIRSVEYDLKVTSHRLDH